MVRVSFVLVASVAGSADFAEDEATSMLQAKVTIHDQDLVCVHANKGDVAPSEGLFNGDQVEIGEVAQVSGRFCVNKDVYALVQRSFALSSVQDVDMALSRKGATVAKDAPSTEKSVSGKKAGNQKKATTPTPTIIVPAPPPPPPVAVAPVGCQFSNEPPLGWRYFWDPACTANGGVGCNADGKSIECRFCGFPRKKFYPCPADLVWTTTTTTTWVYKHHRCDFMRGDPGQFTKHFWDPTCEDGDVGCKADHTSIECRFCGGETFVPCPAGSCQFFSYRPEKFFWDTSCKDGGVGCNADGRSNECRFCGGDTYVACPEYAPPHNSSLPQL